jgi:hypothetical protein
MRERIPPEWWSKLRPPRRRSRLTRLELALAAPSPFAPRRFARRKHRSGDPAQPDTPLQ